MPLAGALRVEHAVGAGDDGAVEVVTGVTVDLADPADGAADRPRHVDPRPLADRDRTAVAAAKPTAWASWSTSRSRSAPSCDGAADVVEPLGLADQLLELGESPAVGVLGGVVEHLAGVAEPVDVSRRLTSPASAASTTPLRPAARPPREVEDMDRPARPSEQGGEMAHSLGVANVGAAAVA